jgi:hypothetical protein
MSLLEKSLIDNYVQYYKDIPAKMAAKDYEPRCCAIDLEYEVFRGKKFQYFLTACMTLLVV